MRDFVIHLFPPLKRPPVYIRVLYDADTENGLYTTQVMGGACDGLKLTEQTFRLYAQGHSTLEEIYRAQSLSSYLDDLSCRNKPKPNR